MSARWDGYPSAEQPSDLGWRLCLPVPGSVDKVDYPGISPTFRGELGGPGLYSPVKGPGLYSPCAIHSTSQHPCGPLREHF